MNKKPTCKTGLKKNVISRTVFEREITLCRNLNEENNGRGCGWGSCKNCGVIPLLYKLHKGVLIEDKKELAEIRRAIFFGGKLK
jgi:hypothetical protein